MRVACSRCQTKYDVPGDRLAEGAVKVRCSECGNVFVVRKRSAPAVETEAAAEEAKFDDFDFASFQDSVQDGAELDTGEAFAAEPPLEMGDSEAAGGPPPDEAIPPAEGEDLPDPAGEELPEEEEPGSLEDELSGIGELDLGDFEDLDDDLNLNDLDDLDLGGGNDDLEFPDLRHGAESEEPMERVREEDLLGPRAQEGRVQGIADDIPRLDIQRGPRRAEGGSPSPVLARDRRHSPLLWLVVIVAVATLGFTGFMLYTQRDAAFTFLNPDRIRTLWQHTASGTRLEAVEQRGFYKDLPAGRRVFVIQGSVANRSETAQSLIKVRGRLFAANGQTLASREVFCGNVLSEHELATLPIETVEARLQNEVGEGLRNVDIAPSSEVPFMVVFPSPPDGVEKFNVTVIQAQTGAGS